MDTKDWYAGINLMPPMPDELHVTGEVFVSNPGVQAHLTVREPQGSISNILLLDLYLVQQPGMWTQNTTWAKARYDKILSPGSLKYTDVEIYFNNQTIAALNIDIVQ